MRLWWSDGVLDEEPLGRSCMGGRIRPEKINAQNSLHSHWYMDMRV
jgi:hypothetical protein